MSFPPLPTSYDMKDIILRCFKECEEAEYITEKIHIMDRNAIADHIAKTLIGELLEFEVCRKLGPWLRMLETLKSDANVLTEREMALRNMQGLRTDQPSGEQTT